MDRLSSRTSPFEALAIVCLVSVILVTATIAVRIGLPGLVEQFSGVELTAFVRWRRSDRIFTAWAKSAAEAMARGAWLLLLQLGEDSPWDKSLVWTTRPSD